MFDPIDKNHVKICACMYRKNYILNDHLHEFTLLYGRTFATWSGFGQVSARMVGLYIAV